MKAIIVSLAVLVPTFALANSEVRHDHRLEQAAAKIVALKIGAIRGGFNHEQSPNLSEGVVSPSALESRSATSARWTGWHKGLAPALAIPQHRIGKI